MPKGAEPLSEDKINAARPAENRYKLFDGNGLFLLVTPDGTKYWRFKYRFDGREKQLSFGIYPATSLEDARCKRDLARDLLRMRVDPGALRKEEKAREKTERLESKRTPSVRVTFEGAVEVWKGSNILHLTMDEARFVARLLDNVTR